MKFFFILSLLTLSVVVYGQQDSAAYQLQRTKVNALLADRSAKFGQYDQSLSQRSGIFGLKNKKDMQRSIDILTEIARTDNEIFKELKILLDYKDFEKVQAKDQVMDTENRIMSYKSTIMKLQNETELLQNSLSKAEGSSAFFKYAFFALSLVLCVLSIWLFRTKKLTFN